MEKHQWKTQKADDAGGRGADYGKMGKVILMKVMWDDMNGMTERREIQQS